MPLPPRLPWQHPWLTVQLLLRRILNEPWSDEAWREIRKEIPTVLRERERIWHEGWSSLRRSPPKKRERSWEVAG